MGLDADRKKTEDVSTVILICLSASPSSKRVIRSASRMAARSADCEKLGLYVGTSDEKAGGSLYENIRYAESLGFEVQRAESGDIALTIAEYAKLAGVTDLFIGYSAPAHFLSSGKTISEQLINYLPDTDIHIIPDQMASSFAAVRKRSWGNVWNIRDFLFTLAVMAAATMLSMWFDRSVFSNANIITIYILAVLLNSAFTSHAVYGVVSAVLYVLLFNFLFLEPRFTLLVYDTGYLVTYLVTMIAALLTGSLTSRMKNIAGSSAENAYRARVLLNASNELERAEDPEEIISICCRQLVSLLGRTVVFYGNEEPEIFGPRDEKPDGEVLRKEYEAVMWTKENRRDSGSFTSMFPECTYRYMSLYSPMHQYGVIGIDMQGKAFSAFEKSILISILRECTMALDKQRMIRERQAAEIAAENERLRAGLLRSLSHDLRTPLTSIYGNASNLKTSGDELSQEEKKEVYDDIMEDAEWLTVQMENILSMTKLENRDYLNLSVENVDDVIAESIRRIHVPEGRRIETVLTEEDLYAQMDAKLIIQVLVNLLNNAVKYTPPESGIIVRSEKKDDSVFISVEDSGPGIPDEDKQHIFEMYYTGKQAAADSYRRMGIGLNLCEMILKAHGRQIEVYDNDPAGTVFRFSLPYAEVTLNE